MSEVEVTVDRSRCISAGQCVSVAPDVFDQDDESVSVVLDPTPPAGLTEDVREAAELCPSQAISVTERRPG